MRPRDSPAHTLMITGNDFVDGRPARDTQVCCSLHPRRTRTDQHNTGGVDPRTTNTEAASLRVYARDPLAAVVTFASELRAGMP